MGNGELGIGNWELVIGNCKLEIRKVRYPLPITHYPLPNYYLSQNLKLKPPRERRKRRVGLRFRLSALSFGSSP